MTAISTLIAFLFQAKISERVSLQEFKDYLYLAINTLMEDFKSKSEIMVRWCDNICKTLWMKLKIYLQQNLSFKF
jgi:isopentenyldiphosphate isomerase